MKNLLIKLAKKLDKDMDDLATIINKACEKNKTLNKFDNALTFHLVASYIFMVVILKWLFYFGSKTIHYSVTITIKGKSEDQEQEVDFILWRMVD